MDAAPIMTYVSVVINFGCVTLHDLDKYYSATYIIVD